MKQVRLCLLSPVSAVRLGVCTYGREGIGSSRWQPKMKRRHPNSKIEADLALRLGGNGLSPNGVGWPKSPRALAGRLRRAQTPLRALGIEIALTREGHAGAQTITLRVTS